MSDASAWRCVSRMTALLAEGDESAMNFEGLGIVCSNRLFLFMCFFAATVCFRPYVAHAWYLGSEDWCIAYCGEHIIEPGIVDVNVWVREVQGQEKQT